MIASPTIRGLDRSASIDSFVEAAKIFLLILGLPTGFCLVLGSLFGVGTLFAAVIAVATLPFALYSARKSWRSRALVIQNRHKYIVFKWVGSAATQAEAARRRKLLDEKGVDGTLSLVEEDYLQSVKREAAVKVTLRNVARKRAGSRAAPQGAGAAADGSWEVRDAREGMLSGNGLPIGACGLDAYGDSYGQSAARDFSEASMNSNTGTWASGGYQPPV